MAHLCEQQGLSRLDAMRRPRARPDLLAKYPQEGEESPRRTPRRQRRSRSARRSRTSTTSSARSRSATAARATWRWSGRARGTPLCSRPTARREQTAGGACWPRRTQPRAAPPPPGYGGARPDPGLWALAGPTSGQVSETTARSALRTNRHSPVRGRASLFVKQGGGPTDQAARRPVQGRERKSSASWRGSTELSGQPR